MCGVYDVTTCHDCDVSGHNGSSNVVDFIIRFKILNELEKIDKNQDLLFDISTMDRDFFSLHRMSGICLSANRFLLACTLEHVNAANIQKFIGFFIQCKEVGEDICSLSAMSDLKKLRVTRRNAKAALTRIGTSIIYAIDNRRPIEELRVAVKRLETAFAEVVDKHEKLTECIEEEEIFEKEEKWLNEVQRDFLELETKAKDYVIEGQTENEEEKTVAQGSSVQGDDSVVMNGNEQLQKVKCEQLLHNFDNKQFSCKYKFDKPKMPVFFGDVRDYGTFKSDFKHSIESVYSKRDSILLLRNCLQGKPLDLIKGIGTDYDAAWEYLDAIYGDPRVVADVVTQDIVQFKNLREGEDGRFCDLVHLVRRSCNTLKEVGRPHDMDNNHMLAIIEQKMVLDDRKVWARNLEKDGTSATLDNLLQWMTSEMKCRMRATASVRNTGYKGNTGYSGYKSSTGYTTKCSVNLIGADNVRPYRCWICQSNDHWVDQCRTFLGKSVEERRQLLKNGYACYSCLKKCGKGHNWTNCSRRQRCLQVINGERCSQFHHNLLHYRPLAGIVNTVVESEHQSLLPVVQAEVLGSKGKCIANVLLDSGAQVSLIRIRVAEQLELRGQPVSTKIIKIGGVEEEINTKLYYFKVRPMNKSELFEIRAIGIPDISEDLCEVNLKDLSQQFNIPGQDLHRKRGPIDLLVGVDYAEMHVGPTRRTNNMVARLSPLGWVVFGSNVADDTFVSGVHHVQASVRPIDLSEFWTTEALGVSCSKCDCSPSRLSPIESREAIAMEESCKKVGGRWQVSYPWVRDLSLVPIKAKYAERRLIATEQRLLKDPGLAEAYDRQMRDLVKMGFARKLTREEITTYSGPIHYLAHREVCRPDSKSTPLRIVFNCIVLNEFMSKGPDLLNSLWGVLLRFREHSIAISGDISKMYHQVSIPHSDQHLHRYMWRDLKTSAEPDHYVKTVLTFGDKAAPAMALTALRKTAEGNENQYPGASQTVKLNSYMDDICDSVPTIEQANALIQDIESLLDSGGFHIKRWYSNEKIGNFVDHTGQLSDQNGNFLNSPTRENILGLVWNRTSDLLFYKMDPDKNELSESRCYTKRIILSRVSRLFDPVGFLAAFLVRAKIGLQELWARALEWDEEVPSDLKEKWNAIFEEMRSVKNVRFKRCLTPEFTVNSPILCIFADGSERAFGCCAYLRLELQAAVIASRLYKTIKEKERIEFGNALLFSDSQIVLSWIKSSARAFKPFVSNRVSEVQGNSDPSEWKYIPGEVNVADDVSRGVSVESLNGRWKNGPGFLCTPLEQWPMEDIQLGDDTEEGSKERVNEKFVFSLSVRKSVIDMGTFNSWKKLIRVTAYVLKAVKIFKFRLQKVAIPSGALGPEDIIEAERYLILQSQKSLCGKLNQEFGSLSAHIDTEGVVRVGGRIKKSSDISYDMKNPVLIPYEAPISKMIVGFYHGLAHSGVASTVAKVRAKYWIIRAHRIAKSTKFNCVICRREARTESQFMADLPKERLAPYSPPFFYSSCDYFGPFTVKFGRNKHAKHYGVIFTCLNTRAVHLEMATDYSAMGFLQVLRRFFSIRGRPSVIISDNGSQMVRAEKELRNMIKGWDSEDLQSLCAEKQIKWKFITPAAPHQNGCAESLVKSIKRALKHAIGAQILAPFELYTCFLEAGNLVNQRPIGRKPTDPDDGSYICPNDILLGRASSEIPSGPFCQTKDPRRRLEFIQKIVDCFWSKWVRDVFPALVPRSKWKIEKRNVRVGDIVVVQDINVVRGKWRIGRIVEVFPGSDGRIRNVRIRSGGITLQRPITKFVVILPFEEAGG
ncbi:hypothetical protein GQR58_027818 [Nymphon striatum]|nr:hypothetical protein GQR58_027818 [Nymphon striatum]